jgi:L-ascorbate 6-phosphate lactonase
MKEVNLNEVNLNKDEIAIVWLGQAGFLIKDDKGTNLAIDVYLTDSCERIAGFKRLSPILVHPEQLNTDILLATHNHPDHLDQDAVPAIMKNPGTILIGSEMAVRDCEVMGIGRDRLIHLKAGEKINIKGIGVQVVYADHGELAPDAIGFLIEISGVRIYFTGDTAYCPDRIPEVMEFKPDIIIPPINGAFGNLDSEEAAKLACDTGAKIAIPCHFWTFREHGGNPQAFFEAMNTFAPGCRAMFLTPGEAFICKASDL